MLQACPRSPRSTASPAATRSPRPRCARSAARGSRPRRWRRSSRSPGCPPARSTGTTPARTRSSSTSPPASSATGSSTSSASRGPSRSPPPPTLPRVLIGGMLRRDRQPRDHAAAVGRGRHGPGGAHASPTTSSCGCAARSPQYTSLWHQRTHGTPPDEADVLAAEQVPLLISAVQGFVVQSAIVPDFDARGVPGQRREVPAPLVGRAGSRGTRPRAAP